MVSYDVVSVFTNIPVELGKKSSLIFLTKMIHYEIVQSGQWMILKSLEMFA